VGCSSYRHRPVLQGEEVSYAGLVRTSPTVYAAYAWRMRPGWEGPLVGMLGVPQGMMMLVTLMGSMHPHMATLWP